MTEKPTLKEGQRWMMIIAAYTPAPGDKGGKTKPSKHTKKFKQMFGEQKEDCPPATKDVALNTKKVLPHETIICMVH